MVKSTLHKEEPCSILNTHTLGTHVVYIYTNLKVGGTSHPTHLTYTNTEKSKGTNLGVYIRIISDIIKI